jgi:hypothetical protein
MSEVKKQTGLREKGGKGRGVALYREQTGIEMRRMNLRDRSPARPAAPPCPDNPLPLDRAARGCRSRASRGGSTG